MFNKKPGICHEVINHVSVKYMRKDSEVWIIPELLFSDNGTPVFQVFLQLKYLAIKYPVGKVLNTVPKAYYTALDTSTDIEGNVAVTEYEVLYGRVLFQFLMGKLDLMFLIFTQKGFKCSMFHPALFGPPVGKSHRSIGVDPCIEPLQDPILKDTLEKPVHAITTVETIPVT